MLVTPKSLLPELTVSPSYPSQPPHNKMNDAVLYAKSNDFQRVTTKKVFDEFVNLLRWNENGCDSVLDIGCGTGDVTMELILPLLPSSFRRLLGCDISKEMVNYAQEHYGSNPKVIFNKLDISGNVDEFLTEFGSTDHIVSFFCLHWVRNQGAAMKNIAKLLTANGDCLLLFITSSNIYTVHDEMSKCSKWSQYMKDVDIFTSPYYHSACPTDDLSALLQDVGFSSYTIRPQEVKHLYNNYDEFVNFVRSINPFVKRIPASEQEDFITELAERIMAKNVDSNGDEFLNSTDVVIVYAKK